MDRPVPPLRAAVVDDDRLVRQVVRKTLEERGYAVEEGENGAAGLRLAQSKPDVLVLDLNLPDLSGLAVCRAVRGVPVVFLTASSDERTVVSCLESGASDYVQKPFAPAVLLARVEAVVRSAKAEQAQRHYTEEISQAYTELRETRAEMMLQHQLTGLGVLAAGIAHEMNSPLAALIASLEFAQRETTEREAALADSLLAARRIADLVRRMSAIAGDGERTIKKIDVRARAAQVCAAFADANVSFSLEGPSVVIDAVDGEVRDALTSLVENAIQATQGRDDRKVAIDVAEAGENVVVTVDDNGPGIEEKDLPFLFDPFFTRKKVWKTAGLGLAIAQAAARRHGGEVTVEAKGPLGGARLRLTLPQAATPSSGGNAVRPILAELRGR